jgi:Notch-like protein
MLTQNSSIDNQYMCVSKIVGMNIFTVLDIVECLAQPCKNGATCLNTLGSYRCACDSGWSGMHCEIIGNLYILNVDSLYTIYL